MIFFVSTKNDFEDTSLVETKDLNIGSEGNSFQIDNAQLSGLNKLGNSFNIKARKIHQIDNKLPIIYNQYHQKTLWQNYGNIEIDLDSFEDVVDYWINNLPSSIAIIEDINKDFMLNKNFYKESAIKISSILE